MTVRNRTLITLLAGLALALPACGKKDEAAPAGKPAPADKPADKPADPAAAAKPADAPAPAPAPAASGDSFEVRIAHATPKPDDPVVIRVPGVRVVAAAFDPAVVEGGTAELELDLATLDSGSAKRDTHLRSGDYLSTDAFKVASIKIAGVKKADGDAYAADATVKVRDVEKTFPVKFRVVEKLADGVRIEAEHTLPRLDLGIGKPVTEEDPAALDMTVAVKLTLRPTAPAAK